jgi:hypothetical protein
MSSLSNQADAGTVGAVQPPSPGLVRRALFVLLVFTALAYLPLLLSDSILWDSAPLANAHEEGNYESLYEGSVSSGAPQVYSLYYVLGHFPDYLLAYKLTAFLCMVGAAACVFQLCLSVPFLGLLEAFAIAAVAAVYPFDSVRQELVTVTSSVCYFLFLLASCCYSRYLSDPPSSKWWLVLALPLFLASFAMQSLLVYFYALFLFFFLRQQQGFGVAALWRFALRNAVALVMPVVFFLTVHWLFPTYGTYEEYNQIKMSPVLFAKWLVVVPKRVALDQLKDLGFAGREPLFFLALLGFAAVVLLPAWWVRRLPSKRPTGREFAYTFAYAVFLFYAAVFPYAIVGKFPVVNEYTSRHGLLAAVPIAIGMVAVLRYALRNDRLFAVSVGIVLAICVVQKTRASILWQNRYIKYVAIVEHLKDTPDELASFVVLDDQANFGMPTHYRNYEVNWITKRAYGNERHMGFDTTNFTPEYYKQMNVPAKRAFCMAGDFEPSDDVSWITIEDRSPYTELGTYLGYLLAGSQRHDFLESLVDLSIRPAKVPWTLDEPADTPPPARP